MISSITAFGHLRVRDLRAVLRGDDHGVDGNRLAVEVAHGKLGLGVGPQPRQTTVAAHFRLALHDAMRVIDGKRHELRRVVAGIAEHEPLVAGPLIEVEAFTLVHALGRCRVTGD